jgi:PTS system cellobiose-specific IIC component
MFQRFLDNFAKILEEKVLPPLMKLAEQRHFAAIRLGIQRIIPLIIVGSIPLIIAFPPIKSLSTAVEPYRELILIPFHMTFGVMSLYVSFGIAAALAASYDLDSTAAGITSMMGFLLAAAPMTEGALPASFLGGTGLFTAVIVAVGTAEIMRLFKKSGFTIKMPEGVPPAIMASFESITTVGVITLIIWLIRSVGNINIPQAIMGLFQPLVVVADTLPAVLLAQVLHQALWSVGIHGTSVVIWGVMAPFLTQNLAANASAQLAGNPIPFFWTEPMQMSYAHMGGSGATLPLIFFYLRSRSTHLKQVGKVALIPGIFNINEPITFGTPIILNPIMLIPWFLSQPIIMTIVYIAANLNLVTKAFILPPWTTPVPFYQYIMTGGDFRSVILAVVVFCVSAILYYPFFKIWEKRCVEDEMKKADEPQGVSA